MSRNPLLGLPARILLPLLLVLLSVLAGGVLYVMQVATYSESVDAHERLRLAERLTLEQSGLEAHVAEQNLLMVRRLVSGLALHQGVTHAWLVDADDGVVASLSRAEIGQPIATVLGGYSPGMRAAIEDALLHRQRRVRIHRVDTDAALIGHVDITDDQHLILRVDLARPLAQRLHEGRGERLAEAALFLGFAALIGALLHLIWFRRASALTRTAHALSAGDLSARSGLAGADELAAVGGAMDAMAERLETQHGQLARLDRIIDHSPVVAISWSSAPGWPATFVSANIRRWGYEPRTFTSGTLNYSELIHPDDLPTIAADVARHSADGPDEYTQFYRMRHRDGHWIHIEDHSWLTRGRDGAVLSIEGVLLDVSERQRLWETQRETLNQLHNVANASPALLWTSGLDTRRDWFNQRWLTFTGRRLEQELGEGWTIGVHPDDLVLCQQTYVGAFDAREPFSMEYRLRRNDGEYRWLIDQGLPRRDADARFVGYIGSCLDITEDKQTREALRDSEERLRLALVAARQGMYDLDLRTGDATVNPDYASMLGYEPEGFHETNAAWLERLHPDDHARVRQIFQDYVGGRIPEYRVEFRQRTRDGRWKWVLSVGRIQTWSAEGQPLRMLGTHTDIDATKAAEAALMEMNATLEARVAERTAALQALNQSLENFVNSVSHDLKGPLRGVEGYSRLLEEDHAGQLDDEGHLFISNIRSGVARMGELIDDLLDYSRMERRGLSLDPVDAVALVRHALAGFASELTVKGFAVDVDVPPMRVVADPSGLGIVLRNLIENAIKFSRDATAPQIEIGGRMEEARAILWVRDKGIGFDMKYHDRIFEIFQRLHRLEDYPGTGIGLALASKAMQRMGGELWAESSAGQGATFYLALPLASESPPAAR